eukprot:TRINITY_DN16121_c0_g1_i2.p1 TRINITY_DN16121_c0_g1~~TRINITY_DN16121_c0_g1_i2.p1  ORF type:complete len:295 (+),score=58.56 TRINITY_DN16121_c0_g1_i2:87-971(+)
MQNVNAGEQPQQSKSENKDSKNNNENEDSNNLQWSLMTDNQLNSEIEKQIEEIQKSNPSQEDLNKLLDDLQISGQGETFILGSLDDMEEQEWQVPRYCCPIHANVTTFKWQLLYDYTKFDVILMDPPWQLASANPTRGVALGYSQLSDDQIMQLPIQKLQQNGFLFVWVINTKYKFALDMLEKWGYEIVEEIVWVKVTVNGRLARSHGFYLQHAKEVCLVGKRGENPPNTNSGVLSDVIVAERQGQSQKPGEIYELIEELVPGGRYLEIFARKNNLRDYWVSVGNEVTGLEMKV